MFSRGAGVPDNMTSDIAAHLRATPKDANKYQMVRTVLKHLNAKGNPLSVNGARCSGRSQQKSVSVVPRSRRIPQLR